MPENKDMRNVAYTDEYRQWRRTHEAVFCPECFVGEELRELSPKYSLAVRQYYGGVSFPICGTECDLFDNEGQVLYTLKSISASNNYSIIRHSNGREYLLFCPRSCGYSVLDLTTFEDFHYFPACVLDGGEGFIWGDAHYNPSNDVLALGGRYRGMPASITLLDFRAPMKVCELQLDVRDIIRGERENVGDIGFLRWSGVDLYIRVRGEDNSISSVIMHEDEYLSLIQK